MTPRDNLVLGSRSNDVFCKVRVNIAKIEPGDLPLESDDPVAQTGRE